MRHFHSRLLMLVLAVSLAASLALGQTAPQPTITSVQGSFIETTYPMTTSVTAGVTYLMLTVTGTNFDFVSNSPSQLAWVPSAGGCPVASCVFSVSPVSLTQFIVFIPDAVIANADPGATVVVRNLLNNNSAPFSFPVNPKVTNATMPLAYINVPYAAYITNGGTPVYTVNTPVGGVPGLSPSGSALGGGKIMGTPTLLGTFSGSVTVLDAWDQTAPSNAYTVNVGALPVGVQGVPYAVQSPFVGGPYLYTVTAGSLPPGIAFVVGNGVLSIAGTPTAPGAYAAAIRIDLPAGGTVATGSISINVLPPVAITTLSVGTIPPNGAYLFSLSALGGIPPYTWSVSSGSLPAGLTLNSSTGAISGTATGKGSTFGIRVTDQLGLTNTKTYILDFQLQLTPATLPAGQVGINYLQFMSVTGGSGSFTCSISQGTVPPLLFMNSACEIGGPPRTAGSFPFTVQVADQVDGQILTQPYTVVINPSTLTVTTTSPLPDTPMGAISIPLAATGGTPPYTWSVTAGSLPPGVSLSTAGVVTGAATAQGSFTFTATVSDSASVTASRSFTIKIGSPPIAITTGALPDGLGQTAYSATVGATGGVPPYKWSATGLPSGLTIDSATGVISGTPGAQGTFPANVTVADNVGGTISKTLTIKVTAAPLQITSQALPDATATLAYTAKLTATGGVLPYKWSATGLPPALTIDSASGVISGTPGQQGTFTVTVTLADSVGGTISKTLTIKVTAPPLVIVTSTLPGATAGLPYTQSLSATGGVPPFTWTATLPPGLKIDANTGAISGASLVGGPQTLVVTVTDAAGTFVTNTYPVTFALPPLPAVTFAPVAAVPATQPTLAFSLASPNPLAITGTATITLKPDGNVSDPAVVFASGKSTAPFTIAAGSQSAAFAAGANSFQTGTVAGTITITLSFQAGGLDITPSPAPSAQIRIAPQAPVITSVTATRNAGTLTVVVTGYSVTREVTQALFHLGVVAGANVTPTDFTLPMSSIFGPYFQGSSSAAAGGQFVFTQPFSVAGDPTQIQSVGVSLTNSAGTSASVTAPAQ